MGKARHGSIRSPLWRKGGVSHGPRSPTPYFYMLPHHTRILGLISSLSIKLAQDDLHLVQDLQIPNDNSSFIIDLINRRNWGSSVLFVDHTDSISKNFATIRNSLTYINFLPVYGKIINL